MFRVLAFSLIVTDVTGTFLSFFLQDIIAVPNIRARAMVMIDNFFIINMVFGFVILVVNG
jgi:hypothetical protein